VKPLYLDNQIRLQSQILNKKQRKMIKLKKQSSDQEEKNMNFFSACAN